MKKLTRQQAIDAKCHDCAHDPLDRGTWRMQVERCGGVDCPLYPYRPLPKARSSENRAVQAQNEA